MEGREGKGRKKMGRRRKRGIMIIKKGKEKEKREIIWKRGEK